MFRCRQVTVVNGVLRQLYKRKNCSYWRAEIAETKGDKKRPWRTLHGVLGEASNVNAGELTAEDFAVFFKDKVESVCTSTASTPLYNIPSNGRLSTMMKS